MLVKHALLLHVVVIELYLANEAPMLTAPVQRLEALQDAVNNERIILVTHRDEVSMALHITRQTVRAICLGDIDTDWAAGHTFDHFMQF